LKKEEGVESIVVDEDSQSQKSKEDINGEPLKIEKEVSVVEEKKNEQIDNNEVIEKKDESIAIVKEEEA
jgi:hypothetical protein